MSIALPFSKGVNFSKWFETRSIKEIDFNKFTQKDFEDVKSLGLDVIRIPIRFHDYTTESGGKIMDKTLFNYLDTAVDWADKYGLYVILDNHTFHPVDPTDDGIDKILVPVWEQVAHHYKDASEYIIYEILNEPHGISDERWNKIQGDAIKAIRDIDQKHAIIVGGTNYNSIEKMLKVPQYDFKNLIYTFHFYDPHLFTHQGATWNKPSLSPLKDLPFPLGDKKIPAVHETFKGTWVEDLLKRYDADSRLETISGTLDKALNFSKEKNVPIFCGEFGVFMIQSPQDDRVRWYKFICGELAKRNISWACWDYFGGFGIFKTQYRGAFPGDLDKDIIKAMGLNDL